MPGLSIGVAECGDMPSGVDMAMMQLTDVERI